ncbi:MAG: MFS transporter, partial [Chitinophagaceae bacterium]
ISVAESGMFNQVKQQNVSRGNLLMFFNNSKRFKKYILAILIGMPTWFVIGILVNLSNRFATEFYGKNEIESGRAIMYAYAAIAIGDILVGFVSQYFKSRKKALYLFYFFAIVSGIYFFSGNIQNDTSMYIACAALGFSTGFWAIFVTMGAEQFGTNLRATAATTIPNFVRGSLPLINLMFVGLFQQNIGWSFVKSAMITGIIVMAITLVAAYFTEETFHKDLNYTEPEDIMP